MTTSNTLTQDGVSITILSLLNSQQKGVGSLDVKQLLLFAPNVKGKWVDSNFQIIDLLVPPRAAGVD